MLIESTAFGSQQCDPDQQIVFPLGLPGFEQQKSYQLFHQEPTDVVGYLQSLDDPDLTFSVLSPESLNVFYEFILTDEEQALIDLQTAEGASLLVIVYGQPEDGLAEGAMNGKINANFMSPLVINTRARLGMQKTLQRTERRITIKAD